MAKITEQKKAEQDKSKRRTDRQAQREDNEAKEAFEKTLKTGRITVPVESKNKDGQTVTKNETIKLDYMSKVDVLPGLRLIKYGDHYGFWPSTYKSSLSKSVSKEELGAFQNLQKAPFSKKSADPLNVDETYEKEDIYPVDDDFVRVYDEKNKKFVYFCTGNDHVMDGTEPCPMEYKTGSFGKKKQCWWKLVGDGENVFLGEDKLSKDVTGGCINLSYGNRYWGRAVDKNGEPTQLTKEDPNADITCGISNKVKDCRIEKILTLYPSYFQYLDPKYFKPENAEELTGLVNICKLGVQRHASKVSVAEGKTFADEVVNTLQKRIDKDKQRIESIDAENKQKEADEESKKKQQEAFEASFDNLIGEASAMNKPKESEEKSDERTKK